MWGCPLVLCLLQHGAGADRAHGAVAYGKGLAVQPEGGGAEPVSLVAGAIRAMEEGSTGSNLPALGAQGMHVRYSFGVAQGRLKCDGTGDLWLSSAGGLPRLRLNGEAHSPRFGNGEVTLVADTQALVLYASFKLHVLHKTQCVTYRFPRIEEAQYAERMEVLRWRKRQVMEWLKIVSGPSPNDRQTPQLSWSSELKLQPVLLPGGKLGGVDVWQGERVTKRVRLEGVKGLPKHLREILDTALFRPPGQDCEMNGTIKDRVARLEFKPLHYGSSALSDLLLALAAAKSGAEHWPPTFLLLSTILLAGDVAVMIEEPKPPNPQKLGSVAFDFVASMISKGIERHSEGSIWLDFAGRALRLHSEAKHTKVGPLVLDFIALGGSDAKLYANFNLSAQEEQQCAIYPYPELNGTPAIELEALSEHRLSFYAVAQVRGQDVAIFIAPLPRQRWIHVWVDLEGDPDMIVRAEIHRNGKVVRKTEFGRWRTGEDPTMKIRPSPAWGCSESPSGGGRLAALGLHEVHKRSSNLQDTLYALRRLDPSYVMLEVVGLAGDVDVLVQDPELPDLGKLHAASFAWSAVATEGGSGNAATWAGASVSGTLAADLQGGHVRMTATDGHSNISVALEPGVLAVRVAEAGSAAQCVTLPFQTGEAADRPPSGAGAFKEVELIGEAECNHFTLSGSSTPSTRLDFWYSKEDEKVCRFALRPGPANRRSPRVAVVDVLTWVPSYFPDYFESPEHNAESASQGDMQQRDDGTSAGPVGWHCRPVAEVPGGAPWLSLGEEAAWEALPASMALASVAEASGLVGLLSPDTATMLSKLAVASPSKAPATKTQAPEVDLFGPELETFSFSFTSFSFTPSRPLRRPGADALGAPHLVARLRGFQGALGLHRGDGELRVDLAGRRLYLGSGAKNVSGGLQRVRSQVIFRGDQGRLYARTRLEDDGYEKCWSMHMEKAVPALVDGLRRNPFRRAQAAVGGGPWLEGAAMRAAKKYLLRFAENKRAEFFVEGTSLSGINLDDFDQDVTTAILVHGWSTAQIDGRWFELSDEWNCEELYIPEYGGPPAQWDLIRMFFPTDADDMRKVLTEPSPAAQ